MTTSSFPSPRFPRAIHAALALAATAALLLGACSSTGGHQATKADLKKALPKVTDIGGDYKLQKADKADKEESADDKASDAAIEKACPEAAKLADPEDGKDADEVKVDFEVTADGRSISASADLSPRDLDEDSVDTFVTAVNKCGTVSYTTSDQTPVSLDLSAKKVSGIGDVAVEYTIDGKTSFGGTVLKIQAKGISFLANGLGGEIQVTSGLDGVNFTTVAPDSDKLEPLAKALAAKLADI